MSTKFYGNHIIINATQHLPTTAQREAGVEALWPEHRKELQKLLTFETLPSSMEVSARAHQVAQFFNELPEVQQAREWGLIPVAMIGGAPFFMAPLEIAFAHLGIPVVYAFSTRESVESQLPDGTVYKQNIFRHAGFVPGTMLGDFGAEF